MAEVLTLWVEPDRCQGHGRCYVLAPDLLTDDDQGYVAQRGSRVPVPLELADQAELAAASCPEFAIELSESTEQTESTEETTP